MFCTADSLSSAIWPSSFARSAQSSHIFLVLPETLTDSKVSTSFSQDLQVGMAQPNVPVSSKNGSSVARPRSAARVCGSVGAVLGIRLMKSTLAFLLSSAIVLGLSGCSSKVTGAVDGEWDIVQVGDKIKPSSLTVAAGKVTGAVIDDNEGEAIVDFSSSGMGTVSTKIDCIRSKKRLVVDLNVSGNALNGSFTEVREYTGSACAGTASGQSYTNRSEVFTVNGTRTKVDAASDTDLNGTWELSFAGGAKINASVKDLAGSGTVFGKDGKQDSAATFSVVNGTMTLTATDASIVFKKR
jgi:hypothetical protein